MEIGPQRVLQKSRRGSAKKQNGFCKKAEWGSAKKQTNKNNITRIIYKNNKQEIHDE